MVTKAQVISRLPLALRPVIDEQQANTAVALILRPADKDYQVLLVKRAKNLKDPWSGHIALPGGKREANDTDLKATVIRETFEETGLQIEKSNFLGVTTAILSKPVSNLTILPFITLLTENQRINLNEKELEAFMWIPIEKLRQNKAETQSRIDKVPAFVLDDVTVWGITYKILEEFLQAVEKAAKIKNMH